MTFEETPSAHNLSIGCSRLGPEQQNGTIVLHFFVGPSARCLCLIAIFDASLPFPNPLSLCLSIGLRTLKESCSDFDQLMVGALVSFSCRIVGSGPLLCSF